MTKQFPGSFSFVFDEYISGCAVNSSFAFFHRLTSLSAKLRMSPSGKTRMLITGLLYLSFLTHCPVTMSHVFSVLSLEPLTMFPLGKTATQVNSPAVPQSNVRMHSSSKFVPHLQPCSYQHLQLKSH